MRAAADLDVADPAAGQRLPDADVASTRGHDAVAGVAEGERRDRAAVVQCPEQPAARRLPDAAVPSLRRRADDTPSPAEGDCCDDAVLGQSVDETARPRVEEPGLAVLTAREDEPAVRAEHRVRVRSAVRRQDQPEWRPHECLAQHVADLVDLLDPRGAERILEALLRLRRAEKEPSQSRRAPPRGGPRPSP